MPEKCESLLTVILEVGYKLSRLDNSVTFLEIAYRSLAGETLCKINFLRLLLASFGVTMSWNWWKASDLATFINQASNEAENVVGFCVNPFKFEANSCFLSSYTHIFWAFIYAWLND